MFPSPTKRIQKKSRKTTTEHLGIGFPLDQSIPAVPTAAGERPPRTSRLQLCSSETFPERPKKGPDFPLRGFGQPPLSYPSQNEGGKEYSRGYQLQINIVILMSAGFGSNCLSARTTTQRTNLTSSFRLSWFRLGWSSFSSQELLCCGFSMRRMLITLMFLAVAKKSRTLFPVSHVQWLSRCAGAGRERSQAASPTWPVEMFHTMDIMLSI